MLHLFFHGLLCCLRHNERMRYGRQQNMVIVNGQPIAQQCPEQQMEEPKIKATTLKGLGITQIILGVISMAIGAAMFEKVNDKANINTTAGLWGGAFIFLSASFTMAAGFKGQEVIAMRGLSIAFNIVGVAGSSYCGVKVTNVYSSVSLLCRETMSLGVESEICSTLKAYLMIISVVMVTHSVIGIIAASFSGTCCCNGNAYNTGAVFVTAPPPMVVSTSVSSTTTMPPPQYPGQPYQYPHCAPPYTTHGYPAQPSHQPSNMQMTATMNSTNLGYTMQETHDQANMMVNE